MEIIFKSGEISIRLIEREVITQEGYKTYRTLDVVGNKGRTTILDTDDFLNCAKSLEEYLNGGSK